MRLDKGDLALTTINILVKHSPAHIKTHRGVSLFEAYIKTGKATITKAASDLFTTLVLTEWKSKHEK